MMNAKQLIKETEQRLMTECHKKLPQASATELHNALSGAAMDAIAPLWAKKEASRFPRRACPASSRMPRPRESRCAGNHTSYIFPRQDYRFHPSMQPAWEEDPENL